MKVIQIETSKIGQLSHKDGNLISEIFQVTHSPNYLNNGIFWSYKKLTLVWLINIIESIFLIPLTRSWGDI